MVKLLWAFCFFAVTTARTISNEDLENPEIAEEESFKVEPHIFENKILDAINKLRDFLKNGDPENGVQPLDPYFLSFKDFRFFIMDTALTGHFQNTTFANFSKFEVENVEFKLLPLHFKINVWLNELNNHGNYKLLGKILNKIPLNAAGKFISETKNLSLSLFLKPTKVNSSLQIKDLLVEFKTLSQKINYTNELLDDKFHELDENMALYVMEQAQDKYFPPLLNMVKLVLNHFLLGYSFADILKIILQLWNKNGSIC